MDYIKSRQVEKAGAAAGAGLLHQLFAASRPETGGNPYQNIKAPDLNPEIGKLTALLERQALEQDGRARCMSATVALLKYAHRMTERAEETIRILENRIGQLEELATTDDLTGLKNRRGFFESFTRELEKCERGLSKGGMLIMIDLDNFKAVNDSYGHMAGDACLRLVARTLQQEVRLMDVAARLGGDEFVLLLSNSSKERVAGRAQALAWQLNHLSLAWYGEELPVRASLGLRPYGRGDKADRIFNAADIALYACKRERKKGQPME